VNSLKELLKSEFHTTSIACALAEERKTKACGPQKMVMLRVGLKQISPRAQVSPSLHTAQPACAGLQDTDVSLYLKMSQP
jgi:hypothetical protein